MDILSGFKGCILGLSLGDSMGAPFEGRGPGEKPLSLLPKRLRYTDDTEMALGAAGSLAERGEFNADDMAKRFAANFNPLRGYGPGAAAVLGMIKMGMHWSSANRKVFSEGSFGNGAAMRAAPIGLFFHRDFGLLKEATMGASAITHDHPLAKEGALWITASVADIVNEKSSDDIIRTLDKITASDEYRAKLDALKTLLSDDPGIDEVISALGTGIEAANSVPCALYAFLRFGDDYLKTIRYCLTLGGDTDTIGAMAGALSGASVGIDGLPDEFLKRLEAREEIEAMAEMLYEQAA